jgi:hypothetical protein
VDRLDNAVVGLGKRLAPIEDQLPLKADKEALIQAIKEIREEIARLNIEEGMLSALLLIVWILICTVPVQRC